MKNIKVNIQIGTELLRRSPALVLTPKLCEKLIKQTNSFGKVEIANLLKLAKVPMCCLSVCYVTSREVLYRSMYPASSRGNFLSLLAVHTVGSLIVFQIKEILFDAAISNLSDLLWETGYESSSNSYTYKRVSVACISSLSVPWTDSKIRSTVRRSQTSVTFYVKKGSLPTAAKSSPL